MHAAASSPYIYIYNYITCCACARMRIYVYQIARDHYYCSVAVQCARASKEMSENNLESDEWLIRPKRCRVEPSNYSITDSADSVTTLESECERDGSGDYDNMSNTDTQSTSSEAFFPSDSDSDSGIPSQS